MSDPNASPDPIISSRSSSPSFCTEETGSHDTLGLRLATQGDVDTENEDGALRDFLFGNQAPKESYSTKLKL